jgi:hypothetical protein
VRPIAHLGKTEMLRRETESLHCHLGETETPIGETELIRGSGSGYFKGTRWRRRDHIGGAEIYFMLRTYLELREWLRSLEQISKHFEQVDH